eukprot:CAMPEP_0114345102 /NCGR_PEP_ID=MMETSP0101-20121206/11952_1 /TAXON_ID=38822 ORGANISM="Pteridomonas danica, Strain PT" /NCGR_SAMPLE_ID=MMETSP0101 /ASSEMBLY_ACC=CAM_ASM_000211 /LENGTH=202 /DNA_ID=CAMNT_0001480851 /DNA_START=500 /DNA_END=1108 /DNA_ORIENTATION=-
MTSAMGTQKWLDLKQYSNTKECILKLKKEGWIILATDLSKGAKDITTLNFRQFDKYAIVLGNEERGISSEMRELCDHRVFLPMKGFAQSFSLSVGCASIVSHLNTCGALKDDQTLSSSPSSPSSPPPPSSSSSSLPPPPSSSSSPLPLSSLSSCSLSESERNRILCKWAIHSVRGSRAILRREGFDMNLYPKNSSIMGFKTR